MKYIIVESEINKHIYKRAQVECPICKKKFVVKISRAKKSETICCCSKHSYEYKSRKQYDRMCEIVGEDFKKLVTKLYWDDELSCSEIAKQIGIKGKTTVINWMYNLDIPFRNSSEAIANQYKNKERRELSSKIAKEFLTTQKAREKALEAKMTPKGRKKASEAKKGANNPMFGVKGKAHPRWNEEYDSNLNVLLRKDLNTRYWRQAVFKRDNYTCVCCGDSIGGNLNAHHLNGWNWCKEQRYDVDNGVTLCENCHLKFHKVYGYGDNTKEQFNKFIKLQVV